MYKREYTCDTCGYKTPRKQNLEIHHSRKSACEKHMNRKSKEEVLKPADNMLCVECIELPQSVECTDYDKPKLDHIDYKRTCELYEETVGVGYKDDLQQAVAKICKTVYEYPDNKRRLSIGSEDAKYIEVLTNNKYKSVLMDKAMSEILTVISDKLLCDLIKGMDEGILNNVVLAHSHIRSLRYVCKTMKSEKCED